MIGLDNLMSYEPAFLVDLVFEKVEDDSLACGSTVLATNDVSIPVIADNSALHIDRSWSHWMVASC